jgi:hypothetical protein
MGWVPRKPPPIPVLHAGEGVMPSRSIPAARRQRSHSVICGSCGASVHPGEPACTYCKTVPPFVDLIEHDSIEVTTLNDETRVFVSASTGERLQMPPRQP